MITVNLYGQPDAPVTADVVGQNRDRRQDARREDGPPI